MPKTRRNGRAASVAGRSRPARTPEYDIQVALIEWVEWQQTRYPCLDLLYAIPDGGDRHRVVAARLKAEGVRSGVLDLCLPVAHQGYHSLYIEMKAAGGSESDNQKWWRRRLTEEGYR